jgi:hypothetical protein
MRSAGPASARPAASTGCARSRPAGLRRPGAFRMGAQGAQGAQGAYALKHAGFRPGQWRGRVAWWRGAGGGGRGARRGGSGVTGPGVTGPATILTNVRRTGAGDGGGEHRSTRQV